MPCVRQARTKPPLPQPTSSTGVVRGRERNQREVALRRARPARAAVPSSAALSTVRLRAPRWSACREAWEYGSGDHQRILSPVSVLAPWPRLPAHDAPQDPLYPRKEGVRHPCQPVRVRPRSRAARRLIEHPSSTRSSTSPHRLHPSPLPRAWRACRARMAAYDRTFARANPRPDAQREPPDADLGRNQHRRHARRSVRQRKMLASIRKRLRSR